MAGIPKKRRGGGGAPAAARGSHSARRNRPPPATASALGSVADAMAAHRRATERNAQAARDAATAAREDADVVHAAQDLLLSPTGGSPPLPSTAPVLPQPPPAAPPQPAAGGAPPGVGDGDDTTTALVPGAIAPAQGDGAFIGGRMGAVLHNPPLLDPRTLGLWDALAEAHEEGDLHGPVATDAPVLAYLEPQVLPFNTSSDSAPRESAFGATERRHRPRESGHYLRLPPLHGVDYVEHGTAVGWPRPRRHVGLQWRIPLACSVQRE